MGNLFADSMEDFKTQLEEGRISIAYQGITGFFRELRSHFEKSCPDYEIPGNIYYGFLDMTYFSILPPFLKDRGLKIAVVFVYDAFRFEVWLSGRNRGVQQAVSQSIQHSGWQTYHLTPEPRKADSVLDHVLVEDPDFSDLDDLTAKIESGTLEFIQAVVDFFADHPDQA
jgi:hypothetical protein